jgi:signal peptidase
MTGHDPDDTGDDPADARDDPNEPGTDPSDAGDAPTDAGDDTDGAHHTDEDRPGDWPDDWTTADDATHSPTADDTDDADEYSSTASGDDVDATEDSNGSDDVDAMEDSNGSDDVDATEDSNGSDDVDSADGSSGADDRAVDAENAAALASSSEDSTPETSDQTPEKTESGPESSSPTAASNDEEESSDGDADGFATGDADESATGDADESATGDADESATGDADGSTTSERESSTLGERPDPEKPPAPGVDDGPTIEDDGVLTWFRNTNNSFVVVVRDIVSSVAAVAAIGLLLFAISGIWPPLVAVESGSMEPHMSKGDLVFLVDEKRYAPQSAIDDTGVSTFRSANAANGYSKFGASGDVIVYEPFGDQRTTPIIHRARFHVEKGENWVQDANPEYLGSVDSCAEVPRDMCPAPYDGFITKGDANSKYDQVGDQSTIVKDDWIRGKAEVRVPLLGWIRLQFAKLAVAAPTGFAPFGAITARIGALGVAGGMAVVSTRL